VRRLAGTARGGTPRARRQAFAMLALLALILITQTLLAVHRVAHDNADNATCALCVAADHQAGPAPAAPPPLESAHGEVFVPPVESAPLFAFVAVYRSRAPPSNLAA
jgi:hypothetical protein